MAVQHTFTSRLIRSAATMAVVVGVLWVVLGIDVLLDGRLIGYGVRARELPGLLGILWYPLIHLNAAHLVSNSVPLFVLGTIGLMSGVRRWLSVTGIVWLGSGLFAWALTPPNTVVVGASGVIFGYLTYLLVRGIRTHDWRQLLLGVVIFLAYGSILWGVFPTETAVSWQSHLGGAVSGIVAAFVLHARGEAVRRRRPVI